MRGSRGVRGSLVLVIPLVLVRGFEGGGCAPIRADVSRGGGRECYFRGEVGESGGVLVAGTLALLDGVRQRRRGVDRGVPRVEGHLTVRVDVGGFVVALFGRERRERVDDAAREFRRRGGR